MIDDRPMTDEDERRGQELWGGVLRGARGDSWYHRWACPRDRLTLVNYAKPPWWSRIPAVFLTHPFELALGVALVATLVRALLVGAVSPSIDSTLPTFPRLAYQIVSGLAGIGIIVGLLTRERWRPGRTVERAGMWLAFGAFGGYAIVLGATNGWDAFVNVVVSAVLSLACLARALAIRLAELLEYRALRYANRGVDDKNVGGDA
jgi:hypothetical protein